MGTVTKEDLMRDLVALFDQKFDEKLTPICTELHSLKGAVSQKLEGFAAKIAELDSRYFIMEERYSMLAENGE